MEVRVQRSAPPFAIATTPRRGRPGRASGIDDNAHDWRDGPSSSAAGEDRIGEYRIVRLIHAGVTAAVVEVVQESTQRRYVVKPYHHQH